MEKSQRRQPSLGVQASLPSKVAFKHIKQLSNNSKPQSFIPFIFRNKKSQQCENQNFPAPGILQLIQANINVKVFFRIKINATIQQINSMSCSKIPKKLKNLCFSNQLQTDLIITKKEVIVPFNTPFDYQSTLQGNNSRKN